MIQFLIFVCIPIVWMWMLGFRRAAAILFLVVISILIIALGFVAGGIFEFMFLHDHFRTYQLPALSTNSYANNMETLGQGFAIPYIFIWDLAKIYVHYTFTHATWIMWAFQLWSIFIVLRFWAPNKK